MFRFLVLALCLAVSQAFVVAPPVGALRTAAPAIAEPTMLFGAKADAAPKKRVVKKVVKKAVKKVAAKKPVAKKAPVKRVAAKKAGASKPISAFFGPGAFGNLQAATGGSVKPAKKVAVRGRVVPTRAVKAGFKGPAAAQPGSDPKVLAKQFFSEENWAFQAVSMLRDLPSK